MSPVVSKNPSVSPYRLRSKRARLDRWSCSSALAQSASLSMDDSVKQSGLVFLCWPMRLRRAVDWRQVLMILPHARHPKSTWVAARGYVGPRWPATALFVDVPALFIFDEMMRAATTERSVHVAPTILTNLNRFVHRPAEPLSTDQKRFCLTRVANAWNMMVDCWNRFIRASKKQHKKQRRKQKTNAR